MPDTATTARLVSKAYAIKTLPAVCNGKISPAQTLILDSSCSRQGNIYNGDTQNSNPRSALVNSLADSKAETARLYRSAYSLTHDGAWEWGDTKT